MLPWKSSEQAPKASALPWVPTMSIAEACRVPLSPIAQLGTTLAQSNTRPTMKHDIYLIIMFRKACVLGGHWKLSQSAIIIISSHSWRVLRKRQSTGGMAVFIPAPESKQPFSFLRCKRNETSLVLLFKYCYSEGVFIVRPGNKKAIWRLRKSLNFLFFFFF